MSRTQTRRPANGLTRSTGLDNTPQSNQNAQIEQRVEHRGAYAVIAPNEGKRQKTLSIADKEAQDFEEYKRKNTQRYNICTTVGGQSVSSGSSSRLVNSSTLVTPASQRLLQQRTVGNCFEEKRRSYQNSLKDKENAQISAKLQAARQQSIRNEESQSARKKRLDEDRKIKNDAFLRKLEELSKQNSQKPHNS